MEEDWWSFQFPGGTLLDEILALKEAAKTVIVNKEALKSVQEAASDKIRDHVNTLCRSTVTDLSQPNVSVLESVTRLKQLRDSISDFQQQLNSTQDPTPLEEHLTNFRTCWDKLRASAELLGLRVPWQLEYKLLVPPGQKHVEFKGSIFTCGSKLLIHFRRSCNRCARQDDQSSYMYVKQP
jgi:hypothetical protein